MKLLNIQGLTKTKIIEIERLLNKQTVLFLTETQQKFDKTNLSPAYLKYMSMRDQQEKKGGGLMMIISKEQRDIVLNPVKTTSKDLLIMKGNLKSFKVTIILVYLSVIRNEVEKKKSKCVERNKKRNT